MRGFLIASVLGVAVASVAGPRPQAGQANRPEFRIFADSARNELVLSLGPIDLPGRTSHHEFQQPPVQMGTIPVGGNLYRFRIELVDAKGRAVPQKVVHHMNLIDPDHRELFLPISRRLLAMGSETGPQRMPRWLFGVPLQKGQRLILAALFHNPTDVDYRGVHLRIVLPYTPDASRWPLFKVHPFQLDVMFPVGDKSFDLPPGGSQRSFEARPALAGRILAIGGHLHDFAVTLRFEDATTGELIWEGEPLEDERGAVVGMPVGRLWWKLGVRVDPSHLYRVTAIYDNPTGDTIYQGGMGVVGGIFLPADEEAWPEADRQDPLYLSDLRHALRLDKKGTETPSPHTGHETQGP